MDINRYIKELLFQHDCVIIPGFGGFVTNYFPAEINSSINTIIPPSKAISFNSNLVQNDGLLINFISISEGIKFNDAKKSLSDFTDNIRDRLYSGETVKLNGIGSFFVDEHEKLQFEPDLSHNFLVDSFGLGPINIEEIRPGALQTAYRNIEKRKAEYARKGTKKNKSVLENFFSKRRVRNILIGVAVILTIVLIPFNSKINKLFKVESAGFNPINELSKPMTGGTENNNNSIDSTISRISYQTFENPVNIKAEDRIIKKNDFSENRYFLVVGSFRSFENAENYSESLFDQGYNSEVLPVENSFYRVSVYASSEKRLALDKKNQISSATNNLKLWLLEK